MQNFLSPFNSFISRVWTHPRNPFQRNKLITNRLTTEKECGYTFLDQVGSGRYGIVRIARKVNHNNNNLNDSRLAIKSVPKAAASLSDISREIRLLETLGHHRNVLHLLDSFETLTHWHLVTPLYEGGELFDRILEMGSFQERDAAECAEQILQSIIYIHSKDVVHRDIKPENLLFASHSQSAPLVLVDFGMAREFKPQSSSKMSTQCGSFSYVAPEVLSKSYTHMCDAWSAGVVLHILLSGRTPFGDGTEEEILSNVKQLAIDYSHPSWEGVSWEAKEVTFGLLERNPDKRLTPKEALSKIWFKTHVFRDRPLEEARERLSKFIQHRKLKKAAIRVLSQLVLDENEEERVKKMISSIDRDERGRVSLGHIVTSVGAISTSSSLQDHKDLGFVDPVEIMAAAVRSSVYLRQRHLEAVFKRFDRNGDGKIDLQELKLVLEEEDGDDVEEVMKDADVNGDGFICFEEFIKVMGGVRKRMVE